MSEKTLSSNLLAKLAIAFAAIVVAIAMATAPGQAYAAAGSSTEPDDIISVNWTATDPNGGTHACSDTVDLSTLTATTNPVLGALFEKTVDNGDGTTSNQVSVVKTDQYVTIAQILADAEDSYSYTYYDEDLAEDVVVNVDCVASDSWTNGKSLTFNVWNYNKAKTEWTIPSLYTKNNSFTNANMTASLPFYEASGSAISNLTTPLASGVAVIALKSTSVNLANEGLSASDVLTSSVYASLYPTVGYTAGAAVASYDTPRLVWGYDSTLSQQMGNRFPSNIDAINIV